MKFLYVALTLSAFQAYTCHAAANTTLSTTITCSSCPSTTVGDVNVTRTNAPTTSCTAPALTIISNSAGSSASATPAVSGPATFTGAGNKMAGSMSGALALAVAVVYVL